jgi:hypothetical protein
VSDNTRIIRMPCVQCFEVQTLIVTAEGVEKRRHGAHVQDAFPELSAAEREMFISGICGKCWDLLFPPEGVE